LDCQHLQFFLSGTVNLATVVSGAAEADIHAVARVQVADLRILEVAD
jgi:hypothetical protein